MRIKSHPAISSPREGLNLLSVSPSEADHHALTVILSTEGWKIHRAKTFWQAKELLTEKPFMLVVCDQDLPSYTWRDVLGKVSVIVIQPVFIVTSQAADDQLWSEAVNLGTYHILAKPFDPVEVKQIVSMAWLNWKYQHEYGKPKVRAASG